MVLKAPNKGNPSPAVARFIDSYSWDMIHRVNRGKIITSKHFAFSTGLHALTRQRKVVQIAHGLGAGMGFDWTMDVVTAQAQKAQKLSQVGVSLPLQPSVPRKIGKMFFWVDNLDKKVDKENGGGSVNIMVMMACQEKAEVFSTKQL